jgi:hypothetical protein
MSSGQGGRSAKRAAIQSLPYVLSALLVVACSEPTAPGSERIDLDVVSPPPPSPAPPLATGTGQTAFVASCTSCHAARDAFDLAYFSYSDTNIVRRALGHVSSATAAGIVAYIHTIASPHVPETKLLWQPGGSVVAGGISPTGDINFAKGLFGLDAWPATLTRAGLLALDPKTVRIAVPLLPWSTEAPLNQSSNSNLEWMPKGPIPTAILNWDGNAARNALAAYYANETIANLEALIEAAEAAATNTANTIAPCAYLSATKRNFPQCFELRRWLSSLAAVHLLRRGLSFASTRIHLEWWDVGDIARRSYAHAGMIDNYFSHWARWMYLGWMFDPAHESCVYTADGQISQQLKRHGVFICLRSLAARAPGEFAEDLSPYMDFQKFSGVTPPGTGWAYNGAKFALNELLRRLNSGDRPPTAAERLTATTEVNAAIKNLQPKVSAAQFLSLTSLANSVRSKL